MSLVLGTRYSVSGFTLSLAPHLRSLRVSSRTQYQQLSPRMCLGVPCACCRAQLLLKPHMPKVRSCIAYSPYSPHSSGSSGLVTCSCPLRTLCVCTDFSGGGRGGVSRGLAGIQQVLNKRWWLVILFFLDCLCACIELFTSSKGLAHNAEVYLYYLYYFMNQEPRMTPIHAAIGTVFCPVLLTFTVYGSIVLTIPYC